LENKRRRKFPSIVQLVLGFSKYYTGTSTCTRLVVQLNHIIKPANPLSHRFEKSRKDP
jgi:hypothetical protein